MLARRSRTLLVALALGGCDLAPLAPVDSTPPGATTAERHTYACGKWYSGPPPESRVVADVRFDWFEKNSVRPRDLDLVRRFGGRVRTVFFTSIARVDIDTDSIPALYAAGEVNSIVTIADLNDQVLAIWIGFNRPATEADVAMIRNAGATPRSRWENHIVAIGQNNLIPLFRQQPDVDWVTHAPLICLGN